jgi:hypothetical protein
MTDTIVDWSDPAFERDAELYRVCRNHGFRPIVFAITKDEAAAIAGRLAEWFPSFVECRFTPLLDADAIEREREQQRHAPLFRALDQQSRATGPQSLFKPNASSASDPHTVSET